MVAVPFNFLHLPEPYSFRNRHLSRIPLPEAIVATWEMRPRILNDMPNQNAISAVLSVTDEHREIQKQVPRLRSG